VISCGSAFLPCGSAIEIVLKMCQREQSRSQAWRRPRSCTPASSIPRLVGRSGPDKRRRLPSGHCNSAASSPADAADVLTTLRCCAARAESGKSIMARNARSPKEDIVCKQAAAIPAQPTILDSCSFATCIALWSRVPAWYVNADQNCSSRTRGLDQGPITDFILTSG